MKTKAAVCRAYRAALTIETVELAEPVAAVETTLAAIEGISVIQAERLFITLEYWNDKEDTAAVFRNGFFRGETRGQMARRKFHGCRILNFAFRENAMKETVAKAIERMLNPRALDQINPNANNTHPR